MTKEEFEALNDKDQKLAKEAYIDGFEAAIEVVKSYKLRTGSEIVDKVSDSTVNQIASVLEASLVKTK